MVKVRIVCPCGSRSANSSGNNRLTGFPAALRRSTSLPNTSAMGSAGAAGGAGTDLNRILTITLFLFVITTYMVLSLDTMMLMDVEVQQQQQDGKLPPRRNLALPQQDLSPVKLIVLEEEESATTPPSSTLAPTTGGVSLEDDMLADSLGALNLLGGLEEQQAEDDEAENDETDSYNNNDERVVEEELDWKRIHVCKDASQGPQMSIAHWIARHRKSAILSDGYTKTPTESRIKHLKTSLNALNRLGDIKLALTEAGRGDYSLCRMDLEQEGMVVVWLPKVKGDALVFVRFTRGDNAMLPPRALAIEIPHSLFDHTLVQGLHVFAETRARALVLSTSHRCSRALPNLCTGNENEPIRNICSSSSLSTNGAATTNRNSDSAHAVMTMFHSAHEQIAADFPALVFASLHSTKADEFVVSDGTSFPSGPESAVWRFARQLGKSLPNTVMSVCNEGGEGEARNVRRVSQEKSFICGATNVQGRHLNGASPDACRAKIPRTGLGLVSSGRFLHIEQPVHFVLPAASSSADSKSATRPLLTRHLSNALIFALGEEVTIPAYAFEPVVA